MPESTSLSLGDHFTGFIDTQLKSGRYGSASEVVRAGLRLQHEARVQALSEALEAGERSGPPRAFDADTFLDRLHETHGR